MRYFLIDRVVEVVPGERARGVKNVTLGDEVLHDHFPDLPVLPGALVVEAMAQLSGFLLEVTFHREGETPRRAVLAEIARARFLEPAGPGDQIEIETTVESTLMAAAKVKATARVGGRTIASATLTFVIVALESARLDEQRRYLYSLWTRHLEKPVVLP